MKTCSKCKEEKPFTEFYKGNGKDGKKYWCIPCSQKAGKGYYRRNKIAHYEAHLKQRYAFPFSFKDYELLEQQQQARCAICKEKRHAEGRLSIDHCHITLKIRGLLCKNCNLMIGLSKDSPSRLRKAAEYLDNAKNKQQ